MTILEYNKHFYPIYNKALSFLENLDHTLSKCDDNAHVQLECIGWDKQTQAFLKDALSRMHDEAQESYRWNMKDWWTIDRLEEKTCDNCNKKYCAIDPFSSGGCHWEKKE
nr:MAG TPA: hypothetical protein [Caudoviricetes sp.]